MPAHYNPIVRTFAHLRAGLMSSLGAARHEVRPSTPLKYLIPIESRIGVWRHLRQQGLRVPALVCAPQPRRLPWSEVIVGLEDWSLVPAVLLLLGLIERNEASEAVHFPLGLQTVGELVLCMTSVREHRDSGYRWTHEEISTRVRMIIAEAFGLTLAEVKPESTFAELESL
jgi:hypothetical protein